MLEKIGRLSTVIFLLNHKNSNNIIDGTVEAAWKQVFQRWKMCWYNLRNWSNWTLKARFGWSLNAMVTVVLTKWRGISFHSWKLSSYIQEHWRLALLFSYLYQRFLDHLLQKNYIEYNVGFSELSGSKGNFSVYFQFLQ